MTSRFRIPVLWVLLLAMWLALNQTVDLGQVLIGASVATAAVLALAVLRAPQRRLPKIRLAAELLVVALADVVRSNLAVASLVLNPRMPGRRAGFVHIRLRMHDATGLAVLACIITSTPGTAWAGYDSSSGVLTMHILDLVDEADWEHVIHERYERRLIGMLE